MNILIAEPLAAPALKLLNNQPGWNVVVSNPKDFARHLSASEALIDWLTLAWESRSRSAVRPKCSSSASARNTSICCRSMP